MQNKEKIIEFDGKKWVEINHKGLITYDKYLELLDLEKKLKSFEKNEKNLFDDAIIRTRWLQQKSKITFISDVKGLKDTEEGILYSTKAWNSFRKKIFKYKGKFYEVIGNSIKEIAKETYEENDITLIKILNIREKIAKALFKERYGIELPQEYFTKAAKILKEDKRIEAEIIVIKLSLNEFKKESKAKQDRMFKELINISANNLLFYSNERLDNEYEKIKNELIDLMSSPQTKQIVEKAILMYNGDNNMDLYYNYLSYNTKVKLYFAMLNSFESKTTNIKKIVKDIIEDETKGKKRKR